MPVVEVFADSGTVAMPVEDVCVGSATAVVPVELPRELVVLLEQPIATTNTTNVHAFMVR